MVTALPSPPCAGPRLTVLRLNLRTGQATQTDLGIEAEFPTIDRRLTGRRHRHVIHATGTRGGLPFCSAIARTNVESGTSQRFRYGPHALMEERLYAPDRSDPGWVIGNVLDLAQKKTLLSCLPWMRCQTALWRRRRCPMRCR